MDTIDVPGGDRAGGVARASVGALSLIAANLGIVVLYLYFDLSLYQLGIIYWCECLWVGVYSGVKLITASVIGDPYSNRWVDVSRGGGVFLSVVIIGFVSSAFFFLLFLLGMAIAGVTSALSDTPVDRLLVVELPMLLGISVVFVIGHGVSFLVNFILLGEFRTARAGTLLALPFKRCLALFAATLIAFGATYVHPRLANTTTFAVILIVLKLLWDYRLHLAERRRFAQDAAGNA